MEENEKNMKIRRSFDRRKNKKKQPKERRTTSIFYYDHSEGGGNNIDNNNGDEINEKTEIEIVSEPENSITTPITPVNLPLSADNTNKNGISKINIFNFNKKSSLSNSSNSSITTISTTSTSSLHITLSINSELSDDTLSPSNNKLTNDIFTSRTPSTANTVFDETDLNFQFEQASKKPLINKEKNCIYGNETASNYCNIGGSIIPKSNYVQQVTLKFENLCKNNSNTNDIGINDQYDIKKKSLQHQRKCSLSEHFGKIFPWINNTNSDEQNCVNQNQVPSNEEIPKISDCEEIFEDKKTINKNKDKKCKNNEKKNDKQNNNGKNTIKKSVKFDQQVSVQSLTDILVPDIYVDEFTENCNLIDNDDDDDNQKKNKKNSNKKRKIGKFKNRNGLYRSLDRPKTEIYEAKNHNILIKSHSYHPDISEIQDEPPLGGGATASLDCYDETTSAAIQNLRKQLDFTFNSTDVPPIIEELLRTEEKYVDNLRKNLENYGGIFESDDLPIGLKGKKFVLFGNIEQIYEFHETILLPMLQNNRNDLKQMFDEFLSLMDENHFYAYIMYTMNKKKSLKLCEQFTPYFKELQQKLDDKLGINSFLVQPIQRLARYPLLLQEFYKTCFGDIKYKQAIASCCKLEKKIRKLLNSVNECEEVNDIEDCFDLDVYYQGQFKKVNEFSVYDYTAKRSYRSKVFIFDKCLIYTEIKDKRLIYRGYYPCEKIGFVAKSKTSFTLYYEKRKRQECDFDSDHNLIELWIDLIRDMIKQYAIDETKKLQELYSTKGNLNNNNTNNNNNNNNINNNNNSNSDIYRQNSEMLYRNSNRISADSGISAGMQTPILVPGESSPKTTWYDTM